MRIEVHLYYVETIGENSNFSTDILGLGVTNEQGELDLTELLPAPQPGVFGDSSYGFALDGERTFEGNTVLPNHTVSMREVAERTEAAGRHPLYLEVPATPWKAYHALVRSQSGKPMPRVRVAGQPAGHFTRSEYLSDEAGRVEVRLLQAPILGRGGSEKQVLVALAPWIGRLSLQTLIAPSSSMRPPRDLVVRRTLRVTLRLVGNAGEPIASTVVKVSREELATGGAGRIDWTLPDRWGVVLVVVPGYVPASLTTDRIREETEVRLMPGRELRIRPVFPVETRDWVVFRVTAPGREEPFRSTGYDRATGAQTFDVPRQTVRISVSHPPLEGRGGGQPRRLGSGGPPRSEVTRCAGGSPADGRCPPANT